MTSPLVGLMVGNVFPLAEFTHSLLINNCKTQETKLFVEFRDAQILAGIGRVGPMCGPQSGPSPAGWEIFALERSSGPGTLVLKLLFF